MKINQNPNNYNNYNDELQKIDGHRNRVLNELNELYNKTRIGMFEPRPMDVEIKENELKELDNFTMRIFQSTGLPKNLFNRTYASNVDRKMIRNDEGIKERWKKRRIKRNLKVILDE